MTPSSALEADVLDTLRGRFSGQLIIATDGGYDDARAIFNGMIDKRPTLIARCSSTDDVVAAILFAREHDLPVAIRCGGHSTPGYSSCDDGLVIDLGPMKAVDIDPEARTARIGGGLTWGELDAATQEHGLAVTGGRVSDTGVTGLTLGSGSGWLERMYGITLREPDRSRGRHRRRRGRARRRGWRQRAAVGPARRRRQFRRRHRADVQPAPGRPDRLRRDAAVAALRGGPRGRAPTATTWRARPTRSAAGSRSSTGRRSPSSPRSSSSSPRWA